MKKNFRNGCIVLTGILVLLFIFRITYGYVHHPSRISINNISDQHSTIQYSVKNYASSKLKIKTAQAHQSYSVDQKYEKIADITSHTNNVKKDEIKVRNLITHYNALIQYEQNYGLERLHNRVLNLVIGVQPEKFAHMTEAFKKIGTITSLHIDKIDKSNEYKDLKAKKTSLIQIRKSLFSLKHKSGKIDEFIKLENRILEIEDKIQKLGISLGEFDTENEFCTIKFSLRENRFNTSSISFIHRAKVAFEWAIKYYLLMLAIVVIGLIAIMLTLTLLEKLSWVKKIISHHAK